MENFNNIIISRYILLYGMPFTLQLSLQKVLPGLFFEGWKPDLPYLGVTKLVNYLPT